MNILFYGKLDINIIRQQLIDKYRKDGNLKEIIICMNGNKYEDKVVKMNWVFEIGDYYVDKYHISIIDIDNIRIYFLLSQRIPYDYIKAYPIYK